MLGRHVGSRTAPVRYLPRLFDNLEAVASERRPIKRHLPQRGGERVVEAGNLLSAAPTRAEVTAAEVHLVLHPLRTRL